MANWPDLTLQRALARSLANYYLFSGGVFWATGASILFSTDLIRVPQSGDRKVLVAKWYWKHEAELTWIPGGTGRKFLLTSIVHSVSRDANSHHSWRLAASVRRNVSCDRPRLEKPSTPA
ncbi:hypothetical protein GUJ93_ZPchr0002g24786 [Zizania palustris]|uniref:Uncharacterized protein n=1 Tax=Zizania palustris TaxID=103762 RepID=A0A8J5VR58_ZIZPA|nr:hypothetical protein GUJ93_ZPchr0002g24786 [Zizania palustris]